MEGFEQLMRDVRILDKVSVRLMDIIRVRLIYIIMCAAIGSFGLSAANSSEEPENAQASATAASASQASNSQGSTSSSEATQVKQSKVPPVVHSVVGDSSAGVAGRLRLYNVAKRQQFSGADRASWDTDIFSPKSATFSPNGKRLYVNSLEGGKTVVYDASTMDKIGVISYSFPSGGIAQMASASGFYNFTHYADGASRAFMGKPVESTWSHDGRYLWVTFYRRSFDINAQDPSAIVAIDTRTNQIVRMFETGPLPKMVATSADGRLIAVTHWGNNTVGFIDVSSDEPEKWHHLAPVTIGSKVPLNFPLDRSVNRDANSGFLLRGTIFTPDGKYLLVSGMAGPLQVVDVATRRHLGSVNDLYGLRHLAISGGYLYGSHNISGRVVKVSLDSLTQAIDRAAAEGSRRIPVGGPQTWCKVGGGARTLSVTPDGKYLLVACNSASAVYVVDAERMEVMDTIRCDSYPVGLAISADGHRAAVTSQGREGHGGNAVNIFRIERFGSDGDFLREFAAGKDSPGVAEDAPSGSEADPEYEAPGEEGGASWLRTVNPMLWIGIGAALALILILVLARRFRRK